MFILTGYWIFQLSQFLETLSTKLSNAGDLDGILLTGDDRVSLWFMIFVNNNNNNKKKNNNIFMQDNHFSYKNSYQHGSCIK